MQFVEKDLIGVRHFVIQHSENSLIILCMRDFVRFTAFHHHRFASISKAIFTICRSYFHVTRCENMALCKDGDIFDGSWLK